MRKHDEPTEKRSRRGFLKATGFAAGVALLSPLDTLDHVRAAIARTGPVKSAPAQAPQQSGSADYTLHIKSSPIEIAPGRILSAITYNGQFPGPLLRFK